MSEIFTRAWAHLSARTWNRHRSAVRSFTTWAAGRWPIADLPALIERRKESTDKTKAIARHRITALLARRDVALREKTFWQLAYESAARAHELLGLRHRRPRPGQQGVIRGWMNYYGTFYRTALNAFL
ncbi:hypothetical protein ACTMTI_53385 [Nonomuraea sp. H19]|uniref:hypothetical protein n=1 Tax=Nonomuraea sp. H19 TaxID=3452206 RepID=UPI003F8BDE05